MDALSELPWWVWTFLAIGILALVIVISSLFVPDFHKPSFSSDEDPPAGSDKFTELLVGALSSPVLSGGTATILQNGDAFFGAIIEAIDKSTDTVNFQCYIWESGKVSDRVIDACVRAAGRGVEVRVLLDAFGAMKFKGKDRQRLRDAGCQLQFFRPIKWYSLVRVFKRSHQRAIVIDGTVGFTGGAAVADKWLGRASTKEEWRDSMTMVTGQLVGGVQSAFSNDWVYCCGQIIAGPRYFPEPPTARDSAYGDAVGVAVVSSPSDSDQPIRICQWLTFRSARKRLYLSNSYFIPDERLRGIVTDRAKAGVDVRIVVPGGTTDARPVRLAGHTHYDELLSAGVRIFEYQPTMMHAKVVVVDGIVSVVGSANLDERSMELNEENLLVIRDAGLGAQVEAGLLEDFSKSKEINLEEWRKRPISARVKERLSRVLIEQY